MFIVHDSSSLESIGQLICVFLLFLFVLFLAYLAARISGSFQSNVLNKKSNIRVIEVFRLSNNKLIEIVQIGEGFYALGVGKDEVSLITELDAAEIKIPEATLEPINFKNVLEKMRNDKQKKE